MLKLRGFAAILILGFLLGACTQNVLVQFATPGAYSVTSQADIKLERRNADPPLSLRVVYPQGQGPWPLIVYSHGTFAGNAKYDRIVKHWTSHGFVVALPQHIDADRGVPVRSYADMEDVIRSRARDMSLVLDALPQVAAAIPDLAGEIAPPPYVAAGHSVGTYVALLAVGLETRNPETGDTMAHHDKRYGYVLMSSDPGNMALMPTDLWLGVSIPRFVVRGSEDFGEMGKGRSNSSYETEVASSDAGVPGSRYLLEIAGADHYFGGLVHKEPKSAVADHEGLEIFNTLSTAFLSAYMRDDAQAMEALRNPNLKELGYDRAILRIY